MSTKLILAVTFVAVIVGIIDAAAGDEWDLMVLFALILALLVALWVQLSWGRPKVALRADLVNWLEDRSVAGGEPVERVADRAVAAYRSGLTGADGHQDDD